jgi:phage gp45-like
MRVSTRTLGDNMKNAIKRVTVEKNDDDPLFREHEVSLYTEEKQKEIEHFEPYGLTSRVKQPTGQGKEKKKAEGLIVFTGGQRSHGVLIVTGDRRYRLLGLKEGEVALFDDQGQQVHFTRDGIVTSAPKSKKIVHQIMDSDDKPKPQKSGASGGAGGKQGKATDGGGQTSGGQQGGDTDGQGAQSTQKALTSLTLTKDSWAVNHPTKMQFTVGNSTLLIEADKITVTSPTVSNKATTRFETIGPTWLGLDSAGEDGQKVLTEGPPAKQTKAKV